MKVEVNNLIFQFDNITIKKSYNGLYEKKYLTCKNNKNSFFSSKEISYDDFIDILKKSQDIYVDTDKSSQLLEENFNYFKITNNPLIKNTMCVKISYIVIYSYINNLNNKFTLVKELKKLLNTHFSFKKDKYVNFLEILTNIIHISKVENITFKEDEENFTLLDFILDYND